MGSDTSTVQDDAFGAGIADVIILPLVAITLVAKSFLKFVLRILIHILDYAFPILLQVARFPLFTLRIVGDGLAALLKGLVKWLPVGASKRDAWRESVSRYWALLRRKISYKAFEEAVHHAFEKGMAWVFRTCRTLTPRVALLVLAGAILWLPISFGIATAMHVLLVAYATSLPPWMQLLHPLATVIAKSKLLVVPVYPAAWPQAKKHAIVQAMFRFYRYLGTLYFMRKTGYRYREMERAIAEMREARARSAFRIGLGNRTSQLFAGCAAVAASIGRISRASMMGLVHGLSRLPLIGPIVKRYEAHYDGADPQHDEKLSEKLRGFFGRWSIKFSAEYYEAKERAEAAGLHAALPGPPATVAPPHAGP
jgi:hypothetical protein